MVLNKIVDFAFGYFSFLSSSLYLPNQLAINLSARNVKTIPIDFEQKLDRIEIYFIENYLQGLSIPF